MNWEKTRLLVWKRDGGVCQVCKRKIDFAEYDCGHVIDRVCGGSDDPDNLVVMCWKCNHLKSITETREEFEAWVENGYWKPEMEESLRKKGFTEEEIAWGIEHLLEYGW